MRLSPVILLLCAGCALSPSAQEDDAQRPASLLDAYLIAHGMATDYATSRGADPAVVLELARLDIRAKQAVLSQDGAATEQAVAALTAYAARADQRATP